MLNNAGMIPVEIELLQEVVSLKELLAATNENLEKDKICKSLKEKQLQLNLLIERRK
jgi:hypothetical protein